VFTGLNRIDLSKDEVCVCVCVCVCVLLCCIGSRDIFVVYNQAMGHPVAQLVGHCTTSRTFAGSIPDGVNVIFY